MSQPQMNESDTPSIPAMKGKPDRVNNKVFRFREQNGMCRDLEILHRHTDQKFQVERADIPELIAGLRAAYGVED